MRLVDRALDRALTKAVARVAAPGGLRYTERQLYYELCRVLQPLHAAPPRPGFTLPPPIGYARYRAALARRERPAGLLPETPAEVRPRDGRPDPPPDLFDYGFPRLLVCQSREIAAMLLANDLHMESACPVFDAAGFDPDPRLVAALRDGAATVHVLHDAGADGLAAVAGVRSALPDIAVNALGLRPEHAAALHLTRQGPTVEVAAVNPARLLRTVHRLVRGQSRVRPRSPLRQYRTAGFLTWPAPGGTR